MSFYLRSILKRELFALVLCTFLIVPGLVAQTSPQEETATSQEIENLKKDLASLRSGQHELRREAAELKSLIEELTKDVQAGAVETSPPEPPLDAVLNIAGGRFLGKVDAPITIVEFLDFE